MDEIAIRCENLGKRYSIGQRERYGALRDTIADVTRSALSAFRGASRNSRSKNGHHETVLWALRGISFEVKRGEVVGIIGRNGAGKSTLLKILSRITAPTEGLAEIHGRIGSLLEVGTGFHPELTGRENIYLNGSIMGMRKAEIDGKFDEIVAFAEVSKFIDTPVKRYSSGMYVRLAFAVAAHLEPEILVVDEVLAVGDAEFQKKCLGKMSDVARGGRTVLFVSHNIAAIRFLCQKAALLHQGELVAYDETPSVIATYESGWIKGKTESLSIGTIFEENVNPDKAFQIVKLEILDRQDLPIGMLSTWDYVKFRIHYHAQQSVTNGSAVLKVSTMEQVPLLLCSTQPDSNVPMKIESGIHYVDCEFISWPFSSGRYLVSAALAVPNKEWLTNHEQGALLEVESKDVFQSGSITPHMNRSLLALPHTWNIKAHRGDQ